MQLSAYSLSLHRQNPNRGRYDDVKQTIQERRLFLYCVMQEITQIKKKYIDDTR